MKPVILVHHPADTDFTEGLAVDLHAGSTGLRCRSSEATERSRASFVESHSVEFGVDSPGTPVHVFVLSPDFERTRWFALLDGLWEAPESTLVLSVQIAETSFPRLLLDKACVDFRHRERRSTSLGQLLDLLQTPRPRPPRAREIHDHEHVAHECVSHHFARPLRWHCIFCGWACEDPDNDYCCRRCERLRPFAGGTATMSCCGRCEGWSLALARYCEWCGGEL